MIYLGEKHIRAAGLHWQELVDRIEDAVHVMDSGDYAQPVKPYLRYGGHAANRIIAMPAYVGGSMHTAGIKWIASFPGNLQAGLPRAHSLLVLNDADTGMPYAIVHASLPSAARTAAVSAVLLRHYLRARSAQQPSKPQRITLGIIGFGPVGQLHYDMCGQLFGETIDEAYVYDIRGVELDDINLAAAAAADVVSTAGTDTADTGKNVGLRGRTKVAGSWQELYSRCNVIITCTVSDRRYIDLPPLPGSLLLDVSLRDYTAAALSSVNAIIVDDWDEVCRENTDIELLHKARGLAKEGTRSLADVVCRSALAGFDPAEPVLFCPMGMAVFDIATANYWVQKARELGIGLEIEA
ncbi:2,3-diaminopropionate biosynthesis protein SbnB [Paenibacillus sp. BIHB 4019]|uniref:2,3-diaminopropionate biosynthesis protein SbnB n=1 Tax=Paenibacillus sp. BIHB 4019 TaxID=1870819 RepID=A0A1B2DDF6_9BACL|nr:2,3-diaminopropionate biosynthesis protein SbnB [Paenibacillus sp. BIHB 4019]ANY65748.1 2,3-diaminopropionate biosynthesis protein SbnB [Paenibacillus sp. BIHB 4019]